MAKDYAKWFKVGGSKKYVYDEEAHAAIEETSQTLTALQEGINDSYYGAGRVAKATDPSFTKEIGTRAGLITALSHLKIGTFDRDGNLTYECKGGRLTADVKGAVVPINGDAGDVLLYTDIPLYFGHCKETFDSSEYNMLSLGLLQHTIGTKQAHRQTPFAIVPHYTVNAKLDGDYRSCAHSIYNPNVAGQYAAPLALFKQQIKTSGNGYFNQYMSSLGSSVQARNKNADPAVKDRYIGLAHNLEQLWWAAMYLEMGTLDFTDPSRAGYGCTNTAANARNFADTGVSGISGMKLIKSGGAESYYGMWGQVRTASGQANTQWIGGIAGSAWYSFTEMLEAQRVLDKIAAANLVGYITPAGNTTDTPTVFTSGGSTIATGVNLSTGEGMVAGQKYYTVRNMPNCQGMADGVMTAVVNIYVKLDVADGVCDTSDNDLTGATAIWKFSHPVYRGKDMMSGMFQQLEGVYYTLYNSNGTYLQRLYASETADDIPVITSTAGNTIYGDIGTAFDPIQGLKLVKDAFTGGGWGSDADYDTTIFGMTEWSGAGQHTKECGFDWLGMCYGQGDNNKPAVGKECVCASVAGCYANVGSAGRTLLAHYAATSGNDAFAGGFALISPKLK